MPHTAAQIGVGGVSPDFRDPYPHAMRYDGRKDFGDLLKERVTPEDVADALARAVKDGESWAVKLMLDRYYPKPSQCSPVLLGELTELDAVLGEG